MGSLSADGQAALAELDAEKVPTSRRVEASPTGGLAGGGSLLQDRLDLALGLDTLAAVGAMAAPDLLVFRRDSDGAHVSIPKSALLQADQVSATDPSGGAADDVQEILQALHDGKLTTDWTSLTAETAIADADLVVIWDDSAGALRAMRRDDFVAGIGGGGGVVNSVFGVSESSVEITDIPIEATVDDTDQVAIYDASVGAGDKHRSMTRANFLVGMVRETRQVGVGALGGLAGGGNLSVNRTNFALDFTNLAGANPSGGDAIAVLKASGDHKGMLLTQVRDWIETTLELEDVPFLDAGGNLSADDLKEAIEELAANYVKETVSVGTGGDSGLTGGGALTAPLNLSVDIAGTTIEATIAGDDEVLIWDTSAGALRSMTRTDFVAGLGGGGGVVDVVFGVNQSDVAISDLTAATASDDADELVVWDDSAGAHRRMTRANLLSDVVRDTRQITTAANTGLAGGAALSADVALTVDIAGTGSAVSTEGADELLVHDSSAGGLRKVTRTTFLSGYVPDSRSISTAGGSGLSGGGDLTSSRSLAVDIAGATEETSIAADDDVLIWDTSAGALRRMSRANFVTGLDGIVNSVFGVSEATITLSDLAAETTIASTDEVLLWDASAAVHRRMTWTNFVVGLVEITRTIGDGAGLTGGGDLSADRTLSVDIDGVTAEVTIDGADALLVFDASAGALRKMTRANLFTGYVADTRQVLTGTGLAGGGALSSDPTLTLDVNGLTAVTSPDDNDYLPIYDDSATALRKIKRDDFFPQCQWAGAVIPDKDVDDQTAGYENGSLWYHGGWRKLWMFADDGSGNKFWRIITQPRHRFSNGTPGVGDDEVDRYETGSIWHELDRDLWFVCRDPATGAAVWEQVNPRIAASQGSAPAVGDDTDDEYKVGSVWVEDVDSAHQELWMASEVGAGAAKWHRVGGHDSWVEADRSSTQAISGSGFQDVICNANEVDDLGEYNAITGAFVPEADGEYSFDFSVGLAAGTLVALRINAGVGAIWEFEPQSSTRGNGSITARLSATDSVKLQGDFNDASATIEGDVARTWIKIRRIG